MSSVNFSVEQTDGRTLVNIEGELTIYAMESLSLSLQEWAQAKGPLTLGLEAVTTIDGSGLQFILILKTQRDKNQQPTHIHLPESMLSKWQTLGLAEIFNTEEEPAYGT